MKNLEVHALLATKGIDKGDRLPVKNEPSPGEGLALAEGGGHR